MKCARRLDNATKSYELMENPILFPLGIFPASVRHIVESLQKYEHYQVDFTAVSFFTAFAAAMGKWEKLTAKQHKQQSLPEEMEMPQRKCHVVVNSTIEALVSALRDNSRGVLIYNDEIDSLLSNFNRYNGSDESYFLSLFSGTPFKYTRKSNNEYIFLPNPYCSIIGSTQPGMLSSLFGGKRSQNGFSSRFLKVYPDIAAMPSWNEASMPEEVLDEWERIIRQVDAVQPPAGQEGKINPFELFFAPAAKQRLIRWKNEVNSRIYVESESEAEKALCGKLETYLIRFCLVIQVMRGICGEADMNEIDEESADRAIRLTEYFRAMESRIAPEMEVGVLDQRHTELLSLLPSTFTIFEVVAIVVSIPNFVASMPFFAASIL